MIKSFVLLFLMSLALGFQSQASEVASGNFLSRAFNYFSQPDVLPAREGESIARGDQHVRLRAQETNHPHRQIQRPINENPASLSERRVSESLLKEAKLTSPRP